MQLDLIDRRDGARGGDDPLQVRLMEVGDADRARQTEFPRLDQPLPGRQVAVEPRLRPVDQVQVDLVQAEPFQAPLQRLDRPLVALRVVVDLGRDEELVAVEPGAPHSLTDTLLVAVALCGVDVAVADAQRLGHHAGRLLLRYLPHAQTQLRDRRSVVQGNSWIHLFGWVDIRGVSPEVRVSMPAAAISRTEEIRQIGKS
jgi:hypothetical protein